MRLLSPIKKLITLIYRLLQPVTERKSKSDSAIKELQEAKKESQRIADQLEYLNRWRQAKNIGKVDHPIPALPGHETHENYCHPVEDVHKEAVSESAIPLRNDVPV